MSNNMVGDVDHMLLAHRVFKNTNMITYDSVTFKHCDAIMYIITI